MSSRIRGVEVLKIRDSIGEVSRLVEERSGGEVSIDTRDIDIQPTPNKGYAGRCDLPWGTKRSGGRVGGFAFIIFGPGEGTGSESQNITLADTILPPDVPQAARSLPRPKGQVAAEFCLAVASFELDSLGIDAVHNAVHLDELLMGDDGHKVKSGGFVGLSYYAYRQALDKKLKPGLNATYTTGYRHMDGSGNVSGDRFGDPHAIVNTETQPVVQVAAFAGAQGDDMAEFARMSMLIGAEMPIFARA